MTMEILNNACDRLAAELDPHGHEIRRYSKDEGAKLNNIGSLMQKSFANRDDLTLRSDKVTKDSVNYTLYLKEYKVAGLHARLAGGTFTIFATTLPTGHGSVTNPTPETLGVADVTADTVAEAVAAAMNKITITQSI